MDVEFAGRKYQVDVVDGKAFLFQNDLIEAFGYRTTNVFNGIDKRFVIESHIPMRGRAMRRLFVSVEGADWLASKTKPLPELAARLIADWKKFNGQREELSVEVNGDKYDCVATTTTEIVPFDTVEFYGSQIEAIHKDGQVWVAIRPICDALGLDLTGQLTKLKGGSWAVIEIISTTGADNKRYDMACLPIDHVPMWLATIHESKVSEETRPKLVLFQREARDVIGRHFVGKVTGQTTREPMVDGQRILDELASSHRELMGVVTTLCNGLTQWTNSINAHILDVNQKVTVVSHEVGELKKGLSNTEVIIRRMDLDINRRLRKPAAASTKQILKAGIRFCNSGKCPCCQRVDLIDGHGREIIDIDGRWIAEYDHFYNRNKNELENMWAICKKCHLELTNGGQSKRDAIEPRFKAFQSHLASIPELEPQQISMF